MRDFLEKRYRIPDGIPRISPSICKELNRIYRRDLPEVEYRIPPTQPSVVINKTIQLGGEWFYFWNGFGVEIEMCSKNREQIFRYSQG